jgi:hypothetical protein
MMIGGKPQVVEHLDPVFKALGRGLPEFPPPENMPVRQAKVICIAVLTVPPISSKWSITASNTASWQPTPKDWVC